MIERCILRWSGEQSAFYEKQIEEIRRALTIGEYETMLVKRIAYHLRDIDYEVQATLPKERRRLSGAMEGQLGYQWYCWSKASLEKLADLYYALPKDSIHWSRPFIHYTDEQLDMQIAHDRTAEDIWHVRRLPLLLAEKAYRTGGPSPTSKRDPAPGASSSLSEQ